MNQDQFKRDKLYYKTIGLIMHDRHVLESNIESSSIVPESGGTRP